MVLLRPGDGADGHRVHDAALREDGLLRRRRLDALRRAADRGRVVLLRPGDGAAISKFSEIIVLKLKLF